MTSETAWTRTSAGSVTISEPETSTKNRTFTGKTASAGGVGQTSPWISSSLSITFTGGGTRCKGTLLQYVDASDTARTRRQGAQPRRKRPASKPDGGRIVRSVREMATTGRAEGSSAANSVHAHRSWIGAYVVSPAHAM